MDTWVLMRGLTRESGHWGRFIGQLQDGFPAARIVALDLPGNGRLNQLRSSARIGAAMEACREQLHTLGIAPPYNLLAMSLGAMVAVDWAVQHPRELAGCVLINTSLRPFSPFHERLRPANYGTLLGLAFGRQNTREREATILRLTTRRPDRGTAVLDDWTAMREARPVSRSNAVRQVLAAARYRAPAQAPSVPLLVLASACDGLVNPNCSRRLARQWGVEMAEHASAGHDLPLDDGAWLAAQVARWAARALRRASAARPDRPDAP
ncbi:acetoin dehydrogenase E2 subunit dihydrolipoyllysine-residue acetyltransferase [Variovorax sp. PBL-H6]|uniref:alpha/beta fold hydrolase n=1 Tax=Variovorax sp. PBL-H6 TaxID=434009 RepID=UPI0013196F6D|nr:alpha/beta hydrolase [Variovorax sp. PBL-H6]VTU39715.1 acetoin dehydrogenase E2 subunit dihydrolipoyllysine-residue acetyltransferase [Variovorax sp. PBL-H6]